MGEELFEKDKWYKVLLNGKHEHLFKFDKLINNNQSVDLSNGHYDFTIKEWRKSLSFSLDALTSFEERSLNQIQDYLPKGHPDKFPEELLLTNIL